MIEAPGPFADFFGRLWRQKPLGIASAIVILILIMLAPLIIVFSINVGGVILAEASLGFLGFGLPVSVPSWGGSLVVMSRRWVLPEMFCARSQPGTARVAAATRNRPRSSR